MVTESAVSSWESEAELLIVYMQERVEQCGDTSAVKCKAMPHHSE